MGSSKTEVVKIQEAVDLLQALYTVHELEGLQFAKRVAANIKSIEEKLRPLDDTMKPSKEFEEFAKIIQEVQGDEEKIKEFESQNSHLVDERKGQIAAVEKMLQDDIEMEFTNIPDSALPRTINAKQLKGLERLIV
tara:strand:- start:1273 stop:1680 length:408 start_codon:yes stop_codon:yes gene_type:complete